MGGGGRSVVPCIFNLSIRWRWVASFMPWYLFERTGGSQAGLDAVMKRKNPCLCWESNPSHPVHSSITVLTEITWLPLYNWYRNKKTKWLPLPYTHEFFVDLC